MFKQLGNIFRSKDEKPVTLSFILGRDDASRLIMEFSENYMDDCATLLIIWEDRQDGIRVATSGNLTQLQSLGLLSVAETLLKDGDLE